MIDQPTPSLSIHTRLLHRLASLTAERRVEALAEFEYQAGKRTDTDITRAEAEEAGAAWVCELYKVDWK